jgi:hypothetical protein
MVIRLMRNTGTRTINYVFSAQVCAHSDKLVQKGLIAVIGCYDECSIALYSAEHTESQNFPTAQPAAPCNSLYILSAKTAQSSSVHSLG